MNDLLPQKLSENPLNDGSDYTAVARRPVNIWTSKQRIVLAWLASHDNSWSEVTRIFNAYFKDELPDKNGLTRGAVSSMAHGMELNDYEEDTLAMIEKLSSSIWDYKFATETVQFVENIARSLGIIPVRRNSDSVTQPKRVARCLTKKTSKRKASELDSLIIRHSSTTIPERDRGDIGPQTPIKQANNSPIRRFAQSPRHDVFTGFPTPPSTLNPASKRPKVLVQNVPFRKPARTALEAPDPKDLPALAFRAFSKSSFSTYTSSGLYVIIIRLPPLPIYSIEKLIMKPKSTAGAFIGFDHIEEEPEDLEKYLEYATLVCFLMQISEYNTGQSI